MELDHFFVLTELGAPAASRLIALGLTEGAPNTHPGQGTACRRFFFRNAMLELLWVRDEAETKSTIAGQLRFLERWQGRAADTCPFGLCFRTSGTDTPAFAGWAYSPAYLPPSSSFLIGSNSDALTEPMLICVPFGSRPDAFPAERRQPLEHDIGFREVTRLRWIRPDETELSPEMVSVADRHVTVASGPTHCLAIGFDGELQGKSVTLAPDLPISFHW